MDIRERLHDPEEQQRLAIEAALQDVMTAAPVEILSFNPQNWTAEAQLLTLIRHEVPTGTPVPPTALKEPNDDSTFYVWERPTMLVACPVVFLAGAGFTMCAPPKPGDEALAIFGFRSIDEWWTQGGTSRRTDLRTHSMHDAFILCGVRSKPRAAAGLPIDPTAFEIRNDTGTTKIRLDLTGITIEGGMGVTVNAGSGNVVLEGAGLEIDGSAGVIIGGVTQSRMCIPITINGGRYYVRLSDTP